MSVQIERAYINIIEDDLLNSTATVSWKICSYIVKHYNTFYAPGA